MKHRVSFGEMPSGEIADLRAFCLAVDLRSLTAAAKALGESKATASRRIARLEESLGILLLRRTPRVVEPTEDGRVYRARIGQVLDLLATANDELRDGRVAPSGNLRVTSPPEFNAILAPMVATFGRSFPKLIVDMVVTQNIVDLDTEHVDVAIRVTFQLRDSSLVAHHLSTLPMIAVASPEYIKGRKPPVKPDDLADHRLILLYAQCDPRKLAFRRADGTGDVRHVDTAPAAVSSDMNFVRDLAVAGGGIAVLPVITVQRELGEGRLVRLLRNHAVEGANLHLFHRGGRFLPAKVRLFRDFMLDSFGAPGRRLTSSASR